MSPRDGLVISINGPWGSGKSTVLNFAEHYLKQADDEKKPLILRFNPWWFAGREDLTRIFFGQLSSILGNRDFKELKKRLAEFATLVSYIPISGAEAGKYIGDRLRSQPDIVSLKKKIGNLLLNQEQKILVLIDDIDRLLPDETRDLFRTIKAVANFPNVIYILAFDADVVVNALQQEDRISGQDYLEKIIQVPFTLPLPDKIGLQKLLFSQLDKILFNVPEDAFDQTYWTNLYYESISHFIRTPRDIARLINVLQTTFRAVEGEVNPVDFIAIEAVRVFYPNLYEIVRQNESKIVGASTSFAWNYSQSNLNDRKEEFSSWLNNIPPGEKEKVRQLLFRLFPAFAAPFTNTHYREDYLPIWRKQLRICSPDFFPIYFRFSVSSDEITFSEIKHLLDKANDSKEFSSLLLDFASQQRRDGTSRVGTVLERLQDYTREEIPSENIPHIINALFDVGDNLLSKKDARSRLFSFGNDLSMGRIVFQLLKRLEEPKRFEILEKAITTGASLSFAEGEVAVFGQQHGKYGTDDTTPKEDQIVNAEHLEKLEQLMLKKIRKTVADGDLLGKPNLVSLLHRWKDWTKDDNEVKEWVLNIVKSDENLATFIEQFGSIQSKYTGDGVGIHKYRLDPKWLEPFIDPGQIIDRAQKIVGRDDLPQEHKRTVAQFIEEYELRLSGINPSEPW